jgi:hypothetical protein
MMSSLTNIIFGGSFLSIAIVIGSQNLVIATPNGFGMCQDQKSQVSTKLAPIPTKVYLQHSDGVYIFSDRQENFVSAFNRRRIVAGKVAANYLPEVFAAASVEQDQCLVFYPSFNDDRNGKINTYGLAFTLAPIPSEIFKIWQTRHKSDRNDTMITILLERDTRNSNLYHFVGWDENSRFSFFAKESAENNPNRQSSSPSGRELLWYQGK